LRACSIAVSLTSVAKICTGTPLASSPRYSRNAIATDVQDHAALQSAADRRGFVVREVDAAGGAQHRLRLRMVRLRRADGGLLQDLAQDRDRRRKVRRKTTHQG